ncbi:hypothetical protein [Streptosporangium roseum]|uniref:Uncharacterized protein n=1 Tax=Streptosporangium roseum (strain ATCC 12428 / DSM 43021 / JCM 3005 / KCTC 9067 / NCIMB 10171 / NRRL 2505 / NI 9100) TaxID=479432 RepID=D2BEC8_STRRD|nr:hypothetical protein [Streptosporangium roseum]ACZ91965.1 hypothetical protein Sros_9347 [Streptosporangium roseum DSM 43021]
MNSSGARADLPLFGGSTLAGFLAELGLIDEHQIFVRPSTELGLIDEHQIFVRPGVHGRWEPATENGPPQDRL